MTCDSKQCWTIEQVRAECGLAHSAGIAEGRRLERAAIVAFIRDRAAIGESVTSNAIALCISSQLAAWVERGEHEEGT